MAKVSIHCDGTDIYIVPEDKKTKTNNSEHKGVKEYKEDELKDEDSPKHTGNTGNGISGIKEPGGPEYEPLLPYEVKAIKANGSGNGNGNIKSNGKGILVLEKTIPAETNHLKEITTEPEDKHRGIIDEIPVAYFAVDLAGKFLFVNERLCRLLGYTRDELVGTDCRDQIYEDSFESVTGIFDKASKARMAVRDIQFEVIRKDGTTIVVEMSAYPMKNSGGDIAGFRCIGRDITERVKSEEALNQTVEKYREALDEVDECYFEVDLSGNFTYVNDATCRQLRRSKEELVGMNYRSFIPDDEIDGVYQTWNKVYRTGEPLTSYHYVNIRRCGQTMFLEDSITPLRNHGGKVIGFRSISRNVTERKSQTRILVGLNWPDVIA
jgi:PAS domain S-box-containing protein